MIRQIKNSSGKIIGTTEILENIITINNLEKPILEITDDKIIAEVLANNISEATLVELYNDYTMSIGEIASLYNRCYATINKWVKNNPQITIDHRGRRNRAYGHPVSAEQSAKMSQALKGHKPVVYERTPEIKQKISNSLKAYFAAHPQNPEPHRKNWANGVYNNVDFKQGIGGSFYSIKMNCIYHFRSLLELAAMIKMEEDERVKNYIYEPFHINMDNGATYLPDFIVNDTIVIELKARKYVERVQGVQEKVEYKKSQAIDYCKKHGLTYRIIYDDDIGFKTGAMKAELRNHPEIIQKYHIIFNDASRMASK